MVLELDSVSKRYGDVWGVRDVTATFEGGVVGLLGPNGAGKSTLIRVVATVTKPTSGTVRWRGTDVTERPGAMRSALGYLPQDVGVYPNLTAPEFLDYVGALNGLDAATTAERTDRLLRQLNLADVLDRPLGGFSGGMRQRVGIACALLPDPELLVVDEPMTGLDPAERARFRNHLAEFADDRLVVFSTHVVTDVEAVASDVAVVQDGRLVAHDAPAALLDVVEGRCWTLVGADPEAGLDAGVVSSVSRRAGSVAVDVVADERPDPDAEPREPTLTDAYLWLTGGGRAAPPADRATAGAERG